MQLIEQFYPSLQPSSWQEDSLLPIKIQTALAKQGVALRVTASSNSQVRATLELHSRLPLERVLSSYWEFSIGEQLEIRVELSVDQS
jgi:hypothetical protein